MARKSQKKSSKTTSTKRTVRRVGASAEVVAFSPLDVTTWPWWLTLLFLAVLIVLGALVIDYGTTSQTKIQNATEVKEEIPVEYVGKVTEADIATVDSRLNCEINTKPTDFSIIQLRAINNSYEGYLQTPTCGVESDFMLSADGVVITTHDDDVTGNCGTARGNGYEEMKVCRMDNGNQVSTLNDFLRLPLSEWYIDLKSTREYYEESYMYAAVEEVVRQIEMLEREDGAIVMMYAIPDSITNLLNEHNIRAGVKGYVGSPEEAKILIRNAQRQGLEMACFNIRYMTPEVAQYAMELGIELVPWETHEWQPERWSELKEMPLARGLITDRPELAESILF